MHISRDLEENVKEESYIISILNDNKVKNVNYNPIPFTYPSYKWQVLSYTPEHPGGYTEKQYDYRTPPEDSSLQLDAGGGLVIKDPQTWHEGYYQCVTINAHGTAVSDVMLLARAGE